MKALIFLAAPLATLYGAMRFEWLFYVLLFLFLLGAFYGFFYSLYRHLFANRH